MPPNISVYFDSQGHAYNQFNIIVKGLHTLGWLSRGAKLLVVQCQLLLEAEQWRKSAFCVLLCCLWL